MDNVTIVQNLFIQDALTHIRNNKSNITEFRYYSNRISQLLLSACLLQKDTVSIEFQTPLVTSSGTEIQNNFIIAGILRAGIAMLQPAIELLPQSEVGFIGIQRDEKTALPHEYCWKVPNITTDNIIIIIDPMLATGGSMLHVVKRLQTFHPKEIRVVSIIAAPEGIKTIHNEFPDIKIFLGALDSHLDENKFIVPGLGDFGNRYFGECMEIAEETSG